MSFDDRTKHRNFDGLTSVCHTASMIKSFSFNKLPYQEDYMPQHAHHSLCASDMTGRVVVVPDLFPMNGVWEKNRSRISKFFAYSCQILILCFFLVSWLAHIRDRMHHGSCRSTLPPLIPFAIIHHVLPGTEQPGFASASALRFGNASDIPLLAAFAWVSTWCSPSAWESRQASGPSSCGSSRSSRWREPSISCGSRAHAVRNLRNSRHNGKTAWIVRRHAAAY